MQREKNRKKVFAEKPVSMELTTRKEAKNFLLSDWTAQYRRGGNRPAMAPVLLAAVKIASILYGALNWLKSILLPYMERIASM